MSGYKSLSGLLSGIVGRPLMPLVLAFSLVASGVLLLTMGATGASAAEVFQGKARDVMGQSSSTTTAAASSSASADTASGGVSSGPGFEADPGTNFSVNQEPEIVARLRELGQKLGVEIVGISGYRSPAHSVAVGGSADDPHTLGEAADIGVNGSTRISAAQITDAELASVGLYRPFDPSDDPGNPEVNHVQLLP